MRYDVIGDGPLRRQLENLVRQSKLDSIVTFHGALDGREIAEILDRSHLFVLTSVTAQNGDQEGTPVSLLEAQAAGLPVISTRHSGIPEIVMDGKSGFLIPERDVHALADCLIRLLDHPELWPDLGQNGRAWVEKNFEASKCTDALLDIYSILLR